MLKFVLLFASMILSPINNEQYQIVEEIYEEKEVIKEIDNNVNLISEDGKYYLKNDEKIIQLKIDASLWDVVSFENNIFLITLSDGILSKTIYDSKLNLLEDNYLIRDGVEKYKIKIINDKLIIVGATNERNELTSEIKKLLGLDGFICLIDSYGTQIHFYGGTTDEIITDCVYNNNEIYVCGYKSPFGEGDFGNGGKYENSVFVAKINSKYEVEKTIILDEDNNIKSFDFYDGSLYLATSSSIYSFDENLNPLYKNKYDDIIVGVIINEVGVMSIVFENKILIRDFLTNDYIEIIIEGKVLEVNDVILIGSDDKKKIVDVILLYRCNMKSVDEEMQLYSILGRCKSLEKNFSPRLDKQVYGEYELQYGYTTIGGIDGKISFKYVIEKEANVSDGGIYPIGFRLRFNGKGYLNGEKIIDNYQIQNQGEYVLELVGSNNEKYSITFYVSLSQIDFAENENRDSDMEVYSNEKVTIKFKVKFSENIVLNYVVINGGRIYDFYYDKTIETLFIPIGDIEGIGRYIYNIERVYYNISDKEYYKDINERYVINILEKDVEISVDKIDDKEIVFLCDDINGCSRWFKIVARNNKEERSYNFPINTQNILINGLNSGDNYYFDIYLVSDTGGKNFSNTLLFSTYMIEVATSENFGKIVILNYENNLKKFAFEFDKEVLKTKIRSLKINDKIVFENKMIENKKYIFIISLGFLVSTLFTVLSTVYRKKKTICS